MRVTRRKVEQAIYDKYGIYVELVNGEGYWYFAATQDPQSYFVAGESTSVYCMTLNGAEWSTVDWWVRQFEGFFSHPYK